jgi:hypothetical protein
MPTEKSDPTFTERFVVPLVVIFVVSSFLGVVIIAGLMRDHEQLGIILFCSLLVIMLTRIIVLYRRVLYHYQCPQCHKELPRHPDHSRQAEYLFYCKDCDILWKTGLKEGE